METIRPCGCKGIRTCLICEKEYDISKPNLFTELEKKKSYTYCPLCNKAWQGWNVNWFKEHPQHNTEAYDFPGVYIQLDFLSAIEATTLINDLDDLPWDLSQSGRRKQNYGPKCNFKKRRLRLGSFSGFPEKTKFVQDRLSKVPILKDFQTIEQCSLEYTPERGASIDPHIDDCWIWGERIVTVNVIGNSVLTMTPYNSLKSRYNLNCVPSYSSNNDEAINSNFKNVKNDVVRLPMPERSLMVLYSAARYKWEHAVLREDVNARRVCLAYREFTPPYLPNALHSDKSLDIIKKATCFW